jgi:hypothetical protein
MRNPSSFFDSPFSVAHTPIYSSPPVHSPPMLHVMLRSNQAIFSALRVGVHRPARQGECVGI